MDGAFSHRTAAHAVHLLPMCFITSDWPITAAVRDAMPERPLQFWTVIWLKYIHLAGADVLCRCTWRDVNTAFPNPLLLCVCVVWKLFVSSGRTWTSSIWNMTSSGKWRVTRHVTVHVGLTMLTVAALVLLYSEEIQQIMKHHQIFQHTRECVCLYE